MTNNYKAITKRYSITVSQSFTPEVQLVRLEPQDGQPMNFDAGMFVMLSGIDIATGQKYMGKAFSVASEPNSLYLEFFVVKEHDGHVSHFTLTKPGDPYDVIGPHGQFKFVPEEDKKELFIAGGTGLAPFMSMLRHIKKGNNTDDVVMLYSVKYPTEIMCKEELDNIAGTVKLKNFITVTRPQPEDGWQGATGHIDANMLMSCAPDLLERRAYICGPLNFVKAVKDALISLKVPENMIRADVWG